MPRPRTVPDAEVLDGVERVLHDKGPHAFTLADVARETGLAPATLLQRFGTKRALLEAFARRAADRTAMLFDDVEPGLASLRKALVAQASVVDDRRRMANSLALLLEDVRDPALGALASEQADVMEAAIERHLRAALAARELHTDDPRGLARTVQTAWNGALILWAIRGRGSLRTAVGRAIDAVLEPYLR
jgi:AcrR family transcriptional regulator